MGKRLLAISGSPHKDGAAGRMLDYAVQLAKQQGCQVDFVNLYEKRIAYCNGCRTCLKTGNCVQEDDIQVIGRLLKACDAVVLAAPVYWANVPAIVKNMFDRLLGTAMEETGTFPKGKLSRRQKYILLTSCNTPAPFAALCGQSTGAVRSMKEFFTTSGMKYAGKCVWAGKKKKTMPRHMKRKIEKLLACGCSPCGTY